MINYIIGDATYPQGYGIKLLCHISNNIGAWGAGFTAAISKRWPEPEANYRAMFKYYKLGNVQFVVVTHEIIVVNMIAQNGIISKNNPTPINYDALRECLTKVNEIAILQNATIHAPKFGAGLAGGKWSEIEKIIKETITVDITIYDLK